MEPRESKVTFQFLVANDFYCSLDELVVFKTRKGVLFRNWARTLTHQRWNYCPKAPWKTILSASPCFGSVHDVTLCGHKGTRQGAQSKQENAQAWELPWFHMKIHDGQWEGMHKQRWAMRKSPKKLQQALCTVTILGFHQDGCRERHAKKVSTLFLLSSSLIAQCLTQSDLSVFFIFLFNRETN